MSEPTLFSRIARSAQLRNLSGLFNDRSLRTKLILAFLAVALLSVGGVALFSSRATQGTLTVQVGTNLRDVAESGGHSVGGLIDNQLDLLRAFDLSKVV